MGTDPQNEYFEKVPKYLFIDMCLYPRLIKNRKYTPNAKNGYTQLTPSDERELFVPIGCGNCIECRQQQANAWRIRLHEELKQHKYALFVTLTISNESFKKISEEKSTTAVNALGTIMVRRFLERWRKAHKKSLCHWLISELGHEHDRLHFHGFIFSEENIAQEIADYWQYGFVYIGEYCNEKTINYCVKYALKIDEDHKDYRYIILCSKGIGHTYFERNALKHKFDGTDTIETYRLPNGRNVNLPIYYRNHVFTEEERTKLWMQRLDKQERYIRGIKIDVSTTQGLEKYEQILEAQQAKNKALGYGDNSKDWKKRDYNITMRKLNKLTKIAENAKRGLQNIQKMDENIT